MKTSKLCLLIYATAFPQFALSEQVNPGDLVGQWQCEKTHFKSKDFNYESEQRSVFEASGRYESTITYDYDYFDKGTLEVTLLVKGQWQVHNKELKISDRTSEVLAFDSQLVSDKNISADQLKSFYNNNYPVQHDLALNISTVDQKHIILVGQNEKPHVCKSLTL